MEPRPDLSGRTALVTGSAKRVGRELLLSIADCGADVVVHYNESEAAATATAEEVRDRGGTAITAQGDITDPDAVDALFDAVEAELGAVDVLVNNVGDFDARHWSEIDWESWRNVVETTFYGTVLCSRRALPAMREQGWGRIVNIGFADSDRMHAHPVNFPYFVAKTGVLMFTRMLAADTSDDGITVNAVSPFAVSNTEAGVEDFPRGRPADFADVAAPLRFFLSDAASYVSGENVAVDGGRLPEFDG
ncbi:MULTISPECIES: SDR family NAD(P)-dependent oxidoreductase [unclassified Halorubrum]|uniref:SDR family NAD(P)-dependent oxidoreductase n=1 Tax=unclassified Halorubrum TaxID=2642239 RepID=UPI0010F6716D|nr:MULTISPECIES: SDR family oxidoreductase [unclassified Halorubrum]TKX41531.1 SDR family oxidoreductase [Halorubrum sp. ARQ200]TKX60808.1 SDR family oxidoreductase [Halorubrum sp. ASP1]